MKLTCKECKQIFQDTQEATLHSDKTGHTEFKFKTIS